MYLISQCLRNRKAILYNNTAAAILDCGGVEILQLQLRQTVDGRLFQAIHRARVLLRVLQPAVA